MVYFTPPVWCFLAPPPFFHRFHHVALFPRGAALRFADFWEGGWRTGDQLLLPGTKLGVPSILLTGGRCSPQDLPPWPPAGLAWNPALRVRMSRSVRRRPAAPCTALPARSGRGAGSSPAPPSRGDLSPRAAPDQWARSVPPVPPACSACEGAARVSSYSEAGTAQPGSAS